MHAPFDPAVFLLAGHLVHAEQSRLRRYLLFILARYLEVPFLRFAHDVMFGRLNSLHRNRLTRALLKRLVFFPLARFGDTAHPMTTADVLALLDHQNTAIAIGPCRCRVAHGNNCGHTLETDMVIRTGAGAFTKAFPHDYRPISREQAKETIQTLADLGLWHMVFVHCPSHAGVNEYAVCNCHRDGCVPFLLNKVYGQDGFPLLRGEHVADVDPARCVACGECLAVCPWEARVVAQGRAVVDLDRCFGCGLCVAACDNDAIVLRRERPRPPLRTEMPA